MDHTRQPGRVWSLVPMALMAMALAACPGSCARTRPAASADVSRFEDVVVYFGDMSAEGLARLKAADQNSARALLIGSRGGEAHVGMDFGAWVHERGLDVVVVDYCLSSCASYVFPAGRKKWILWGGVVAWEASPVLPDADQARAFYQRIGVSECITRFGANRIEGLYSMSVEDMARFGIREVMMGPRREQDIVQEGATRIDLKFVQVPRGFDPSSCP